MRILGYQIRQSSQMKQKNRNAGFVIDENANKGRFKYLSGLYSIIGFKKSFPKARRKFNIIAQSVSVSIDNISWKSLRNDFGEYIIEASIEGIAINFALHFIFGLEFTILTALAYGIFMKQIVSFYSKLKSQNENKQVPKE